MIKMLAIDLDDTLLRQDLTISLRTRRDIKKAISMGVLVVLASGRISSTLGKYGKSLGLHKAQNGRHGYYVSHNGSCIRDSVSMEALKKEFLPPITALRVCDLADAEGFPVQIYEGDTMYISKENEFTCLHHKLTGMNVVLAPNFRELATSGCYKLLVPGDPMLLTPLLSIFETYLGDEATIFTSKPYFLEVLPPGVDKASALAWIAEQEGIKSEEVMAIGDSMNDEAMIRWAGVGCAMINGSDAAKQVARIISERTNDDDGVAELIEKYILNGEPLPGKKEELHG
ncbi:MAG: Cof-type HAD-IIB family hydrolase [Spirochaetaceae bacterium]|jgi:Cof subfamily protein (haloacid dehalogenase superfamily)|nr:Cof-type HAD-IIB family hydrolase [Spirochaetaceae bacterium]